MKFKRIILCLVLFFIASVAVVSASVIPDDKDVIISLQLNNPVMEINGEFCQIDPGRGTKPVVRNGRTLIPIRTVIEALGGTVEWEETTDSAILKLDENSIKLTIDSQVAYVNGKSQHLDVSPVVINGRTMLPVRFISENFNLGIAWKEQNKTIYIIRDLFTESEYNNLKKLLPGYLDTPYAIINGNVPFFEEYEIIDTGFEYYSSLDKLGRCNVCFSTVTEELMPDEPRKSISSVTPTGWVNKTYSIVSGGYLYNRCHLIGFQLTGENANRRNLITGTKNLNIKGMLGFENKVAKYINETGNSVLYRSTPVFEGNNFLASGVLIEAYSIEDDGAGISLCVYCYNVQPGIFIDYKTGESSESAMPETKQENSDGENNDNVYITPTGKRYHSNPSCGGVNSYEVALDVAVKKSLTPCSRCVK